MRYGSLRTPHYDHSDLENISDSMHTGFQVPSNSDAEFNMRKICSIVSFCILFLGIVIVGVADYYTTNCYFKPMYTVEDAQGLSFLYSIGDLIPFE